MQLRTIGAIAAAALLITGCAGPERKFSRGLNNVTEFARMGEIRRSMGQAMGGFMPFPSFEELSKQNMSMLERAMNLFAPFRPPESGQTLESLRAEVEQLKRELADAKARRE